jgi:hypothetical protein
VKSLPASRNERFVPAAAGCPLAKGVEAGSINLARWAGNTCRHLGRRAKILPTAQCSRGTSQSRPFSARSLKVMESAGQLTQQDRRGTREIGRIEVPTASIEAGRTNWESGNKRFPAGLANHGIQQPHPCRKVKILHSLPFIGRSLRDALESPGRIDLSRPVTFGFLVKTALPFTHVQVGTIAAQTYVRPVKSTGNPSNFRARGGMVTHRAKVSQDMATRDESPLSEKGHSPDGCRVQIPAALTNRVCR